MKFFQRSPHNNAAHDSRIVLGTTAEPGRPRPVFLTPQEQAYHATVWGRSGSGKSRFLHSLFLQHLNKGHGVCLIDPHHDLSFDILQSLVHSGFFANERAYQRLVYLDWGNGAVVPFNVLARSTSPHTTALHTLEAMLRVWPELRRAPSFQTLVLSSLVTLIDNQLPITNLHQLLSDAPFRDQCLTRVSDPLVRQVLTRFGTGSGQNAEAGAALRRAFLLSFNQVTRLSFGQPDCLLDMRRFMDSGTSLIVNLGNIQDSETRRLLAALLLVQIEQAALSRTDLPPDQRRPWTVLVDEWAAVAPSAATLGNILDQTRKYGLRLYLASQSTAHIDSDRLAGALENCRLTVVFGLGRESAVTQGRELATPYHHEGRGVLDLLFPSPPAPSVQEQYRALSEDIQTLGSQEAYVKLHTATPVKIRTLGVPDATPACAAVASVLAAYRARYQRSPQDAAALSRQSIQPAPVSPQDKTYTLFGP